jgi:hypothetical protein
MQTLNNMHEKRTNLKDMDNNTTIVVDIMSSPILQPHDIIA